ncbi:TIM21 domain-containing protein [Cephalotus follicularis]|uniref:Mitochondrial import inner membrane translocase subunit Tim21 n=1 Tax=Cephalotus follicularis TaxID=3775 RepID=A0A1Q3C0P6_CEPFO|nr:TIM21 domain-containing protein [Cephalotus follicularis]
MQHVGRSALSRKSRNVLSSLLKYKPPKSIPDVGLPGFSSTPSIEKDATNDSTKWLSVVLKSGCARHIFTDAVLMTKQDVLGANGIPVIYRGRRTRESIVSFSSPFGRMENHEVKAMTPCSARSFASRASKQPGQTSSETKKDISTVEDPFDAPTYNIPDKPVTFAEGASYSVIILAGLGVAAVAAYAVFKELIFEPKEYKIFSKALKRIQDDGQVRVRIGSPITGYGQESRNRAARQRIPSRVYTDEDGVERVEVNFHVRGPHGAGKVYTEMFKDKADKQWKFTYLIVEITTPTHAQLILESYMPAPA